LSQWVGKTLTGWEEIRQALVFVDSLPKEQCNGVRVEVYEHSKYSVKVSFTSLKNLDDYLEIRLRKQLLKGENVDHSRQLGVLSDVHEQVVLS